MKWTNIVEICVALQPLSLCTLFIYPQQQQWVVHIALANDIVNTNQQQLESARRCQLSWFRMFFLFLLITRVHMEGHKVRDRITSYAAYIDGRHQMSFWYALKILTEIVWWFLRCNENRWIVWQLTRKLWFCFRWNDIGGVCVGSHKNDY